jgi:uncharacterized membrane protein
MSRRAILIALGLSVAFNLFFLGVLAARAWQRHAWNVGEARGARSEMSRRPGRGEPFSWLSDAERDKLAPERQQLRERRRQVGELLRAESYDPEKFRRALEGLRVETEKSQASVHAILAERADSATPEERRRLADSAWGRFRDRGRRSERH